MKPLPTVATRDANQIARQAAMNSGSYSDGTTFWFFVIAVLHKRFVLYGSRHKPQMPSVSSLRPEWHIALLPLPYFAYPLLLANTLQTLKFLKGVPAREAAPHIRKRRGARMRSLTLLYHGRLCHCSMVNSNLSAVSSAKSADIWRASSAL